MDNPLLQDLPDHGLPDFSALGVEHFRQAIARGIADHEAEIETIGGNESAPDFANTIEALECSGALLQRVMSLFSNLESAHTNEALQALDLEVSPQAALHDSHIYTNLELFERVRVVRDTATSLDAEQQQLLDNTWRRFLRAGAGLDERGRERMEAINTSLARLTTRFSQNVLADSNAYELLLDESQLDGLPGFVREAAATEARYRGRSGYLFTLSRSSITPFLQYSDHRHLRQDIYRAYTRCGISSVDNHTLIRQIIALRAERARLLGFATHAEYMLAERMAQTPQRAIDLLQQIWQPCREKVENEARELQALIDSEGGGFKLAAWDWLYYTEKLRRQRFQLDDNEVMPYFPLAQVRDGAFEVARRLYGISFHRRDDIPLYHPDVQAFEAREADGTRIGLFLFDYYLRTSKRSGAWMSTFRDQSAVAGHVEPVVINCCNFPHAEPCLLGLDEVRTLFHEFGHGLHGLLSRVRYRSLSGTNVKQDFVEFPSQIMEHWATEPEVLRSYARHVDTAEPIPDALIARLRAAAKFNTGFATTEYLAACFLDMAWHGSAGEQVDDVAALERSVAEQMGNRTVAGPRYRSAYFQHIFSDDYYSAGYYVYIWAQVLDADGFEAFRENGLFDRETAQALRRNVLERGGSEDPMTLYRRFRGRDPQVAALLNKLGLA